MTSSPKLEARRNRDAAVDAADVSVSRSRLLLAMFAGTLAGVLLTGAIVSNRNADYRELSQQLADRPEAERAQLGRSLERLAASPNRETYVELHDYLINERPELRRTAKTYAAWEQLQLPEVRSELAALPRGERLVRVSDAALATADKPEEFSPRDIRVPSERFGEFAAIMADVAELPADVRAKLEDREPLAVVVKSIDDVLQTVRPELGRRGQFYRMRSAVESRADDIVALSNMPQRAMTWARPDWKATLATLLVFKSTIDEAKEIETRTTIDEVQLRDTLAQLDGEDRGKALTSTPADFRSQLLFETLRRDLFGGMEIQLETADLERAFNDARDEVQDAFRDRQRGGRGPGRGFGPPDGRGEDRPGGRGDGRPDDRRRPDDRERR